MLIFRLTIAALLLFSSCTHGTPTEHVYAANVQKRSSKTVKKKASKKKPLIVVDPGHGGLDFGAHNKRCREKMLCLASAFMVKKYLNELGYRVRLTRSGDVFIPLDKRVSMANKLKCDLFVSMHFNAAKNAKAHGIEIYYYYKKKQLRSTKSRQVASRVLSRLVTRTGASSRGVKQGNFCVIRETSMPAILVEGGFITNPKEVNLLLDNKYLESIGLAIAEGIDSFYKQR